MSELEMREYQGKLYKKVAEYGPDGSVEAFRWVEAQGPACPPASLFTEVNNVCTTPQPAPIATETSEDADFEAEAEPEPLENKAAYHRAEAQGPPASLFTEVSPVNNVRATPQPTASIATETSEDADFESEAEPLEAPKPLQNNLLCDSLAAQKTDEVTSVMGDSDDDAASSTGSSSIDHTDESDSDISLRKSDSEISTQSNKTMYKLVYASLADFDFDENLCTLEGEYLINIDGVYVFAKSDIADFVNDGKVHSLHFSDSPNRLKRLERVDVCHKPVYQTLKNIQVRTGPGSKFTKSGIVAGQQKVVVIQEGLMECDLSLVQQWKDLHLPSHLAFDFKSEDFLKSQTLEEEDILELFVSPLTEEEQKIVLKAFNAVKRKVKIMYKEDGVSKYGWISKKKNSGPLIKRVYGKNLASVVVSEVETHTRGVIGNLPSGTFLEDFANFHMHNSKNTIVKYTGYDGKQKERTETRNTYPTLKFFTDLAKQEISSIVGNKRFTIDWQGEFRQSRYEGLEKQLVDVSGKKRYRTGYVIPNKELTVTFQSYKDALKFMEADLEETRFGYAQTEWDLEFENLQPVDLGACPEYRLFQERTKKCKGREIEKIRLELGISFVDV